MYLLIVPEDYIYSYPVLFNILDDKNLKNKVSGVIIKKNFFSLKKFFYHILINDKIFLLKKLISLKLLRNHFEKKFQEHNNKSFYFTEVINNKETIKYIKKTRAKKLFIISCDEILNENVINCFEKAYNLHCSNLPKNRGLFPLFFTIINNEKYFYISIHEVDKKIDNGNIVIKKKYKLYTSSLSRLYEDVFNKVPKIFEILLKNKNIKKIKNNPAKKTYNSYPSIIDIIKFYFIGLYK